MYSVTVKIDGIESKRRSAGLLHIVVGFFLIAKGADYFKYLEYETIVPVIPVFLVAGLSLFYGFFRRKVDIFARYNAAIRLIQVLTFLVLGFIVMQGGRTIDYIGMFIFAFLCFMLMITERKVFEETTVFFDESGIRIPGNYKDYLVKWDELTEVVVREDFLTFFHIKKKYLQYQVMQDLSTLEVAKLNAFCREQIERNASMANKES
ncbi:MAG TPA: hypothetical protein VFQ73_18275 [Flavisolibacter sp.]|nr:hypothetical protein [Flavisolibacter sp.]